MRRSRITSSLFACLVAGATLLHALPSVAQPARSEPAVDARLGSDATRAEFDALANELLDGMMARRPTLGVRLGLHAFDGRLPDHSEEGVAATLSWVDESLARLGAVEPGRLSSVQRAELATLRARLASWAFEWREERALERDPRAALTIVGVAEYVKRDYAPLQVRAHAALAIAKAAPGFLEAAEARLDRGLPTTWLETAIAQARGSASFVRQQVKAAFAGLGSRALKTELDAGLDQLADAIDAYASGIEGRRDEANTDFALGEERFLEKLRLAHGFELDLERLEQILEADLARNRAALVEAAHAIDPDARTGEVVRGVLGTRPAASQVLAVATAQSLDLRKKVERFALASIPSDDPLLVVETPPYLRYNFAFLDAPGPFETKPLPTFYYITPPDPSWPPEQQASYVPATADLLFASVHEAWPGHFLQSLHRRKLDSRILRALGSSATSEGWAHYAEELVWETGAVAEAEARVGQLVNALLRNVRCMSAIGLHTDHMSVEKSERMFRKIAYQDPANARQQAWRGTFDPMYLIYTLGKLAIHELREDARTRAEAAGETFQLGEFHDAFLSYGAAPLPAIREALLGAGAGAPLADRRQ